MNRIIIPDEIINRPDYIILHHSFTKDGIKLSWNAIRDYHINTFDMDDIGYHYGIENVRGKYLTMSGRMPYIRGAHTKQVVNGRKMNWSSIGICCVGNYDEVEPPVEMLVELNKLVSWLQYEYSITDDKIKFHRDYADYKSCPGKLFPRNWRALAA